MGILGWLLYAAQTLANLLFTLVAYVLAPLIAPFWRSDGYLPSWLSWFQTPDAPLDAGWKDGYFGTYATAPTGLSLYWLHVRWLWRNPAYGFCYWPVGLAYVPADWVIDTIERDATAVLTLFKAHTTDGRHFSYTSSTGAKYGHKLWWALNDDNTLVATLPASRGPDNRLLLSFTPGKL